MKRSLVLLTCVGVVLTGAAMLSAEKSEPAAPAAPKEKTELFNGKDLSGWVQHPKDKAGSASVWSVKDGVLACAGKPNGYLRTEKAYANYKLTVEWRFTKPGNTGVLVHISGADKVWPNCVECQGMHGRQGDMYFWSGAKAKDAKEIRGGFTIKRPAPDAEKPVGEWNTYQVLCSDDAVTILVNGKEVNKATGCSANSGQIGLQVEGGQFEVRKVTIEPLGS